MSDSDDAALGKLKANTSRYKAMGDAAASLVNEAKANTSNNTGSGNDASLSDAHDHLWNQDKE